MDHRQLQLFLAVAERLNLSQAAEAMGITATRLRGLGLVDEVIPEPLGGAHRDPLATAGAVKAAVLSTLNELKKLSAADLVAQRRRRLASYGVFRQM